LEKNQAEGIVIKPMRELTVSTKKGATRAIVKKKAPEFSEIKYHEAVKPKSGNSGEISENVDILKWEVLAYVTENRLNNAISKTGLFPLTDVERYEEGRDGGKERGRSKREDGGVFCRLTFGKAERTLQFVFIGHF
jgi:hypothetical protein